MSNIPPDLERIVRETPVQRRIWLASRVSWFAMGATLLLAAAGLFGDGWLAQRDVAAPDGSLRVQHDRFQRADATTPFELLAPRREPDGHVRICLDHGFLDEWRLLRTEPGPDRQEAQDDEVCLRMLVAAGAEVPRLRLWVQPRLPALRIRGTIRAGNGAPVAIRALVWP